MTINLGIEAAYLHQLSEALRERPRQGSDKDEPEGTRYILLSDTLASKISSNLDIVVNALYAAMGDLP